MKNLMNYNMDNELYIDNELYCVFAYINVGWYIDDMNNHEYLHIWTQMDETPHKGKYVNMNQYKNKNNLDYFGDDSLMGVHMIKEDEDYNWRDNTYIVERVNLSKKWEEIINEHGMKVFLNTFITTHMYFEIRKRKIELYFDNFEEGQKCALFLKKQMKKEMVERIGNEK